MNNFKSVVQIFQDSVSDGIDVRDISEEVKGVYKNIYGKELKTEIKNGIEFKGKTKISLLFYSGSYVELVGTGDSFKQRIQEGINTGILGLSSDNTNTSGLLLFNEYSEYSHQISVPWIVQLVEYEMILKKGDLKEIAANRMKEMNIHIDTINQFVKNDRVSFGVNGANYYVNESMKKEIEKFENKYGGIVFYCIENHLKSGETMITMLYVSREGSEHEDDMHMAKNGTAYANVVSNGYHEIGVIGFNSKNGGLIRTF